MYRNYLVDEFHQRPRTRIGEPLPPARPSAPEPDDSWANTPWADLDPYTSRESWHLREKWRHARAKGKDALVAVKRTVRDAGRKVKDKLRKMRTSPKASQENTGTSTPATAADQAPKPMGLLRRMRARATREDNVVDPPVAAVDDSPGAADGGDVNDPGGD
ncbi:hypothetical protein EJ06DRAFT_78834 [Trichodelitschia bisporula]|uniref:Uncharacterized protein n=1 Tax=Trichodelitschia bisporula TaxID=703511 RepID=A0A6G1HTW9_9PEZI|nr:hypothetical protein EJ06DRAFT_78834 [Trichodelitschia bisporula]